MASTTFAQTPQAPSTPQITLIPGNQSINVAWTVADDGGAQILTYKIIWQDAASPASSGTITVDVGGAQRVGNAAAYFGAPGLAPSEILTPVGLASHNGTLYMPGIVLAATGEEPAPFPTLSTPDRVGLYTLDPDTGVAALSTGIPVQFDGIVTKPQGLAAYNDELYITAVGLSEHDSERRNESTTDSILYVLDPGTGAVSRVVRPVSYEQLNTLIRLAWHNNNGTDTLYAVDRKSKALHTIDPNDKQTPQVSQVGTARNFGNLRERFPTGLASHNGTLYMVGATHDALYTLDLETGEAVRVNAAVARFGLQGDQIAPRGLASHNGTLYMVGILDTAFLYQLQTPDNSGHYRIEGLTNGTEYIVSVAAVNDVNASPHASAKAIPERGVVSGVVKISDPQTGDTHRRGEEISVEISVDTPIYAALPQRAITLTLDVGDSQRAAALRDPIDVEGSTALTFTYNVREDDLDTDGISIADNAVTWRPNDVELFYNAERTSRVTSLRLGRHAVSNDPNHKVDGRDGSDGVEPVVIRIVEVSVTEDGGTVPLAAIGRGAGYSINVKAEAIDPEVSASPMEVPNNNITVRVTDENGISLPGTPGNPPLSFDAPPSGSYLKIDVFVSYLAFMKSHTVLYPLAENTQLDDDNDGIPDDLENERSSAETALLAGTGGEIQVLNPGGRLQLGDFARRQIARATPVYSAQLAEVPEQDASLEYEGGIYDFVVYLPAGASTAQVVIPLTTTLTETRLYYKYSAPRWTPFVNEGGNTYYSAPAAENGQCRQSPAAYRNSEMEGAVVKGHRCVLLEIVDGGPNDGDGQRNGIVVDPGGPALVIGGGRDRGGGGVFDPQLLLLLLGVTVPLLLIRRNRLKKNRAYLQR